MSQLKYRFEAIFEDGHQIYQTPEDVSITGEGSAFTDVLEHQKKSPITHFGLFSDDSTIALVVDLRTGGFNVNGVLLTAHNQKHPPFAPLRLIYFRQNRVQLNSGGDEVGNRHTAYHIGYQWNDEDGANQQITIAID